MVSKDMIKIINRYFYRIQTIVEYNEFNLIT